MKTLAPNQIKEIADQIDCGFCCYYHKVTDEMLFIPNLDDFWEGEEFYADDLEKIQKDIKNFIKIDKPSSRENFEIMENFIEEVDNEKLKDELIKSLNKKKPFSQFKFTIDNAGIYSQQWFDFKAKQLQQFVIDQLQTENE